MTGWETLLAAFGGLVLGAGLSGWLSRRRERGWMRRRLELEAKVRRAVVPVLERRADTLGIPPARRGSNDDGPFVLAVALAEAIRHQEDSAELPFGDTLEVGRDELNARLAARAPREDG